MIKSKEHKLKNTYKRSIDRYTYIRKRTSTKEMGERLAFEKGRIDTLMRRRGLLRVQLKKLNHKKWPGKAGELSVRIEKITRIIDQKVWTCQYLADMLAERNGFGANKE